VNSETQTIKLNSERNNKLCRPTLYIKAIKKNMEMASNNKFF